MAISAKPIYMENSQNITVENCFFDQIGENGISMSGYNWYNVVYNNNFVDAWCIVLLKFRTA